MKTGTAISGTGNGGKPVAYAPGSLLGLITILMTLAGWCSVPLFITHFAKSIDTWTSNGWRYGFSAILWAPVLVIGFWRKNLPAGLWRKAIVPSIFNSVGQAAFAWSFYNIDPATATFGLRLQIVFVAIGAYLLFPSERAVLRRPMSWLAIVMVLGGIGATIFLAPVEEPATSVAGTSTVTTGIQSASHTLGVVLAIGSGLCFAAYGLAVRRCMHGFHPVTAFAAISQYTAGAMVGLMLLLGHNAATGQWDGGASAWTGALPNNQFLLLLLSSVIGIALGHVFYYISIARLGVAVSGAVIQLQPFGVAIGSYWLFGHTLGFGQLLGGSIAVVGAIALLAVQWKVTQDGKKSVAAASVERECVAGDEAVGVEAAEMDVVPVVMDAREQR